MADADEHDAVTATDAGDPQATWEERNNAYLTAGLRWLRLRLRSLASTTAEPARAPVTELVLPPPEPEPATAPAPEPARGLFRRRRRPSPEATRVDARRPVPKPVANPAPIAPPVTAEDVAVAAAAMDQLSGDEPPALVEVSRRLGLSNFEREVLLLAVATELDPAVAGLCADVQGHSSAPTFGLALQLFEHPEWEALAPHRPLRRLGLVNLQGAADGVVGARLHADERVVNLLKGLDHLDERLTELLVPMSADVTEPDVPASQQETIDAIARWAAGASGRGAVVALAGPNSASKRFVAARAAAALGLFAVRLPIANLPLAPDKLGELIRLWERDSLLSPLALYVDASDEHGDASAEARAAAGRLLTRVQGLAFVDSREAWTGLDSTALILDEVPNPRPTEQQDAWTAELPADDAGLAGELAATFDLDPVTIHQLARTAGQIADPGDRRSALWQSVLVSTRPSLDLLGRRVEPRVATEDLVLPEEVLDQIERIKAQVRHRSTVYNAWGLAARMSRGLGISALFAGESGTGKTMAAEVIARELELDLYRIDLSGVVSKYIGETEKNLRRVFDAAEQGGTILCFDEADALFGKRSEVKDSHDRYANIEVNYLLQRMEEYRGLAILTTNMKTALDTAFTRRIRFVVEFPFPGPPERERIWRRSFVGSVSTDRLDFARLAALTLSGGSIHNVAVNATFAAAADPEHRLTMPMVLAAARLEYRKNGLPINAATFDWTEPALLTGGSPAQNSS